jgi:FAD/FMN-containing dehydrogenase
VIESKSKILEDLSSIVGASHLRTDDDSLAHYGTDWTRFIKPAPLAIVLPGSVEEVVEIVKVARSYGVGIVPSGGRTGLSAGAVAPSGELVISMDRLNHVEEVNTLERTVEVQAGVLTATVQQVAAEAQLYYPLDFASAGSSQIGGNIATNAGGIHVLSSGMTRDWVAGLTVVTGTGEVLNLNQGLVKNNAGYDLRHLFIGSEGTLGLIVSATLRLALPRPKKSVLLLGVPSMEHVMSVLKTFQEKTELHAFEFFCDLALTRVIERGALTVPIEPRCPYYALIECTHETEADETQILTCFERCIDHGDALDGIMSQDRPQAESLWRYREDISESITAWTPYKYDVSVTIGRVPSFLADVERAVFQLYPTWEIVWFGHIGDGNLHLNILRPDELSVSTFKSSCEEVTPIIYDIIQRHQGSISAEHGVGLLKKPYLKYSRSSAEIAAMRGIKAVFDPDGIMNPGKIFDS